MLVIYIHNGKYNFVKSSVFVKMCLQVKGKVFATLEFNSENVIKAQRMVAELNRGK